MDKNLKLNQKYDNDDFVRVPHDGTLHAIYNKIILKSRVVNDQNQSENVDIDEDSKVLWPFGEDGEMNDNNNNENGVSFCVGQREALKLVFLRHGGKNVFNDDCKSLIEIEINKFLCVLIPPKQRKERLEGRENEQKNLNVSSSPSSLQKQLRAIQSFRRFILSMEHPTEMEDGDNNVLEGKRKEVMIGLYRLLFELSLSCYTPENTMRRALFSLLSAIQQKNPRGDDDCLFSGWKEVQLSVIQSLIGEEIRSSNKHQKSSWNDQMKTLHAFWSTFNLLLPNKTKNNTIHHDISGENIDEDESEKLKMIDSSLRLLLEEGSSKILATVSSSKPQGLIVGVNICSIIKLILPHLHHYFEGRTFISDLSSSVRTKITTLFTDIVEPFFLNFLQYYERYDKCSHSYNLINELNTIAIVFSKMNLFLFHHFNYNRTTLNNNDDVVTTPISFKPTKGVSSEEDSTDYIKSLFEYYIHHHNPHPLIQLALVRGMISLFYNNSITKEKKITLHIVEPFYNHTLHIIQESASIESYDAHVLHQAFKCMDYILSCIKEMPSEETSSLEKKKEHHLNFIIQTLFPIILNSWQTIHSSNSTSVTHQTNNNSNKAISHILPVLFEKLAKMAHLKSTMTTPYTPNNDTTLTTQQQSHECFHFIPTDLSSFSREKTISLEYIVHVILSLPPNQKGRYIALEVLLPLLGAKKLLKIIDSFSSSTSSSTGDKCHPPHLFVYNLLYNIGGDIYGNNKNSGVILNVLKKLLIQYKEEEECLSENSKSSSNCEVGQYENRKARKRRLRKEKQLQREREREKESFTSDKNNKRKLEQLSSWDDSNQREKEIEISSFLKLPITWLDLWTNPLSEILLSPSINFRRKIQIVSFVFPMLATLSGTSNNHQIPLIYSAVLEKLFDKKMNDPGISQSHFIWAVLELIQQYSKLNNGFMESLLLVASHQAFQSNTSSHDQCHLFLLQTIRKVMSMSQLQQALVHKNEKIRVVAFSCIKPVIFAHSFQREENLSFYYLRMEELKLWTASFHYAMNNNSNSGSLSNNSGNGNNSSKDGKIYCVQIMSQLTKFLQSLLDLIVSTKNKKEEVTLFVKRFICDFLIRDIIILKGLYPNTVQEKEKFALNLLETLFTFICVNIGIDQLSFQTKKKHMRSTCVESVSIISSTVFNTNVPSNNKKRRKGCTKEIQDFLHNHVFLPLFGFDHAFITPSQSTASNEIVDTDLVNQDKDKSTMAQPLCYALLQILLNSPWDSSREHAYRLLKQIIIAQTSKDVPKDSVNRNEIEYFYARGFHLASSPRQRESDAGARMLALVSIFSSSVSEENHEKRLQYELKLRLDGMHQYLEQNESISRKNTLPLAHGVFQAIRLYYSHLYQKSTHNFFNNRKDSVIQYVEFCCNAIELALGLVGDYKGDDSSSTTSRSIPLNLNASTIGANAPFADTSKSKAESKSDETQRVIMGSWLLTREAMKTLSTIICISDDAISYEIIANAGILLLKTLTSMKHQGTSFTAHESLQQICDACFCSQREELSELPLQFMKDFLFREITRMEEIVHDSTLRRSTGYALGFLCIMRSLSSSKKKERQNIITSTLAKLVKLSLPTNHEKSFFIYPKHLASAPDEIIEQTSFSWKTRVHALNILRACILDAPLSEYTTIFVGDAIISSMLGSDMDYGSSFDEKEKCWNIQNSSTMVFSACVLRVVDSDKNANRNVIAPSSIRSTPIMDRNKTSSSFVIQTSSNNVITALDLFRRYPTLSEFLLMTLSSQKDTSTFSSLLLLSRLLPAHQSTPQDQNSTVQVVTSFILPIVNLLSSRHNKIRIMAARALACLCTSDVTTTTQNDGDREEEEVNTSRTSILTYLSGEIDSMETINWNLCHGVLIAIEYLLLLPLSTHQSGENKAEMNLAPILHKFSTFFDFTLQCPPSCMIIALRILYHHHTSSNCVEQKNSIDVETIVFQHLRIMNECSLEVTEKLIGMAQASCEVAEIATCILTKQLFSHLDLNKTKVLDKLSTLFLHTSFDVRFSAMKAFKKQFSQIIYDDSYDMSTKLLESLAQTLYNVLLDWTNMKTPHTPSLRRLTKCLIECLLAHKNAKQREVNRPIYYPTIKKCDSNNNNNNNEEMDLDRNEEEQHWCMLSKLRKLGGSQDIDNKDIENNDSSFFSTGNSLSGNSIELMAFKIASDCYGKTSLSKSLQEKIIMFIDVIIQSAELSPLVLQKENTQQLHSEWILRYNVAHAIHISNVFTLVRKLYIEDETLKARCLDLYMTCVSLIQDIDPDVRSAASNTLINAFHSIPSSTIKVSPNSSPLHLLEFSYSNLLSLFDQNQSTSNLITQKMLSMLHSYSLNNLNINYIAPSSQSSFSDANDVALIQQNLQEIKVSENAVQVEHNESDPTHNKSSYTFASRECMNLNNSTNRKIFENEEPNSFEESLIHTQLVARTLLKVLEKKSQISFTQNNNDLKRIYLKTLKILSVLQDRIHCSVAHEITFCSLVFSDIYNTFVTCIMNILYSNNSTQIPLVSEIRDQANELLRKIRENSTIETISIHPTIVELLKVMSQMYPFVASDNKEGNQSPFSTIVSSFERCFFLIN